MLRGGIASGCSRTMSAEEHRVPLVCDRAICNDRPRSRHGRSQANRSRGVADSVFPRQPEREDHGERRLAGSNLPLLQIVYVSGVFAGALLLINVYFDQKSALVRILEWPPIARLGRICYGLYLYNDYVKSDLPQRILSPLLRTVDAQRFQSWTSDMLQHVAWAQTLV